MSTVSMPSLTAPLLEWALWYASLGLPIFPCYHPIPDGCSCLDPNCKHPGKHPRIKGWQQRATTKARMIKHWWGKQFTSANIGLVTGHTSWVLDVDMKHGERGDL